MTNDLSLATRSKAPSAPPPRHAPISSAGLSPSAEQVVVVLGAKGGVGASSVALAIARDLARAAMSRGTTTLLVDAHLGRNDLEIMMRGAEAEIAGLALTSARTLGLESEPRDAASAAQSARRVIRNAKRWTDAASGWVVVDAGSTVGAWQRELVANAERTMLVTTSDELSLVNAYTTLKRLGPNAEGAAVIVNHAADARVAEQAHSALATSCQRFLSSRPPLAGWLPTRSDSLAGAVVHTPNAAA